MLSENCFMYTVVHDAECEVNAYKCFRFAIAHVLFWPEQEYDILKTIFQKAVLKVHKS